MRASTLRLVKSREAYRAINDLLEQRLLTATSTAALFSDQMSDKALQALAHFLSGDEIYLYSPHGVIEYSTRPEYLGWQAPPGHPVHDFMVSGLESLEEDIRRDSESVAITNTPRLRLADGRFVQLGIGADFVHSFCIPCGSWGDHRPGRFRHRLFRPFPHWGAPHRLHQDRQGLHRQHGLQGEAPPDHQGPDLHVPQAGASGLWRRWSRTSSAVTFLESGYDAMQGYLYSKLLLEEEALAKLDRKTTVVRWFFLGEATWCGAR